MEKGTGPILEETYDIENSPEKIKESYTIKDEAETEELIRITKSSKPTDIIHLNYKDLMRYTKFAIEKEIPEDKDINNDNLIFSVPADIVFANTIPVKDLLIKINPNITCRIVMVDDKERNAAILSVPHLRKQNFQN